MPAWSKKKRLAMDGTPHKQTPDLDNLCKGFLDALCPMDDKHIHSIHELKKIWSVQGSIQLKLNSGQTGRDPG
jgi:Holliday junction resolvase RusA-like endonuclease